MADITFECPECKQHLVIDAGNASLDIDCPTCSQLITVPKAADGATTQPTDAFSYAGLKRRFVAGFIDYLASIIPLLIIETVFGDNLIALILFGWVYFSVLLSSSWQATLGMKLMKIKIADENGRRISFGRATGRYFGSLLSGVLFFVGFLIIPFTKRKQGLHDMIVGTIVLKNETTQIFNKLPILTHNEQSESTSAGRTQTNQIKDLTSRLLGRKQIVISILIGGGIIMAAIFCCLVIPWMYGKANYVHQANDSAMKEATRRAWSDIQNAESQLSRDYSSNDQIYSQRAFLYSQINTDDADPELVKYVAQVVNVSKGTASVLDKIASDIQNSHQDGETVEQVLTVVGAVLGASANNDRSVEQNAADGQAVGAIAGTIVNGVGTSIEDDNIKQQYSNDLASCSSNLKIIDGNRAWLADYLAKKYQSQFLSGF